MGRAVMCRGFITLTTDFIIGDTVRHEKYGNGKVSGIIGPVQWYDGVYSTGFRYRVDFDDGNQMSFQAEDLELIEDKKSSE